MNVNSNQTTTSGCRAQTNVPSEDEDGYEEIHLSSLVTIDEEEEEEVPDRSELTLYFTEKQYKMNIVEVNNFDILQWWKLKTLRYPVLSEMAKDILAIPASSVASESAFSMAGRVLSPFRSSLTPKMVEALICAKDWLRSKGSSIVIDAKDICETVMDKEYEDVVEALRKLGIMVAPATDDSSAPSEVQVT